MLPGFVDPYHHRTALTRGEIGCFLSHYFIWKEVGSNIILVNRLFKILYRNIYECATFFYELYFSFE